MPELPEVETVVRWLAPKVKGKTISRFISYYERSLCGESQNSLTKLLKGKKVKAVKRRAKYIVIELSSGALALHLRMTGRLIVGKPDSKDQKHIIAKFEFSDGSELNFKDVRKFATIEC